jgi:hypothetical protein
MFRTAATALFKLLPLRGHPHQTSSTLPYTAPDFARYKPVPEQQPATLDQNRKGTLTVTSYSPWNPCATRTLLFLSSISIPTSSVVPRVEEILDGYLPPMGKAEPEPVLVLKQKEKKKMWQYRLPVCLQPKVETTYHRMHGGAMSSVDGKVEEPARVGLFQAVMYGVENPDMWKVEKYVVVGGKLIVETRVDEETVKRGSVAEAKAKMKAENEINGVGR